MAALLSLILDCFSEKKQPKTVLDAAKAMLEEAAENLDSSILKRKAKSILDRIAVEQN